MIKLTNQQVFIKDGKEILADYPKSAKAGTMAYKILTAHNHSEDVSNLKLKFDSLASHDITYVGVIQTAKASGLTAFPVPYILTNCHNSLCAVGGTINEDDHQFGLSAAIKYGGDYVPAHLAVIHQYMREAWAGCGKMILGTDSHTRYGPMGTMGIGEGGGELVKQLLGRTYDIQYPEIIAVKLENTPPKGVGPQDVALALIKAVFANGFVKNKVLEFIGAGITQLSMDYRIGIDVMTTEAACLSSVWMTDAKTQEYLLRHGRLSDYCELKPDEVAQYDGLIEIDLSKIKPMIAMPFHPSNAFSIEEFKANMHDIIGQIEKESAQMIAGSDQCAAPYTLRHNIVDGQFHADQAIIAGCAGGTYENIAVCREILGDAPLTNHALALSIYPASQPVFLGLNENGITDHLMRMGAIMRTAFCGPCFGAGDVPANRSISIRHTTRNFPSREGARPADDQMAYVALMDARSIAATVKNGGVLTAATDIDYDEVIPGYTYHPEIYSARVYHGYKKAQPAAELKLGPNIKAWPDMEAMKDNMLIKVCSVIRDEVTTTDELIPSGEASSYRSNPIKLAEFTLSRKDPEYRARTRAIYEVAQNAAHNCKVGETISIPAKSEDAAASVRGVEVNPCTTTIGSVIVSNKPGDGSAREQAASCQRVLGGVANIAVTYATKRYRNNLINWGIVPFTISSSDILNIHVDDYIYIEGLIESIKNQKNEIMAKHISGGTIAEITLQLESLQDEEREILLQGCLINYYREN
ncbi:MAG: hydratase [Oscillospiraceae bacterium]|nr:hydratase [Oscillospiraceae bacterium]